MTTTIKTSEDAGWTELSVEVDNRMLITRVGIAPGCERYLALLLHELVAKRKVDVRFVKHWFEVCDRGEPDVG